MSSGKIEVDCYSIKARSNMSRSCRRDCFSRRDCFTTSTAYSRNHFRRAVYAVCWLSCQATEIARERTKPRGVERIGISSNVWTVGEEERGSMTLSSVENVAVRWKKLDERGEPVTDVEGGEAGKSVCSRGCD